MLESTMSAAAGGAGGLMGQLGDILSAPRRFAWNALGLPETGTELLGQTFGMDQESPWTKALGMGAEMVLDPLTYAGMLLGGPLAKLGAQGVNARRTATLGTEIEQVAAARRAAQEALTARAGYEAETARRYGGQAMALEDLHDLPGIAAGKTRTYNLVEPGLVADMENAGFARTLDSGLVETLGQNPPAGTHATPFKTSHRGQIHGSVLQPVEDFGPVYKNLDPLLPDELAALQARVAPRVAAAPGGRWRTDLVKNPGYIEEWANEMAAGANATRPMPTLEMAMRGQFQPTGPLKNMVLDAPVPMARPRLLDMPIDEAFSASQTTMKDLLARRKQIQEASLANALGVRDYGQVAGGSFLGSLGLGGRE